ncbi:hypothetical protein [Methanococcoides seepicolus]|uniref:Uncharacterized protein n=1 Tax=Methanococcoides seepicolus TaxID=2828780 RepID=A0A9E4ZGB8_9EURY|nr:hypothetical protein [Methanococcoides seepicolus]MCM1987076.1 hypothetical protein [Methanococcoides seepicolus]
MNNFQEYFEHINNIAENGHFQMFILKSTASSQDEKKREIIPVDINGTVKELFSSILSKKCDNILENEDVTFRDYFLNEYNDDDFSIPYIKEEDLQSIGTFQPIISKIKDSDQLEHIRDFDEKTIDKLKSYAIYVTYLNEAKNATENCIFFRKYGSGFKLSKSRSNLLQYKNGRFDKLDGDVFKCDEFIDAIYYECIPDAD